MTEIPRRVRERFWHRVEIRGENDCWPWLLSTGSHGYGQIGWWEDGHSVMRLAHRVAWQLTNGPIPDGLTIDHQKARGCSGGICCNPAHLRLLTNEANAADTGNAHKTHCPAGHPYDEANTRRESRGFRICRTCDKAQQRQRRQARKAALT